MIRSNITGTTHSPVARWRSISSRVASGSNLRRVTIVQVETLVERGEIDPAQVHLPGVFVQRVVHTGVQDKRIERRTVSEVSA